MPDQWYVARNKKKHGPFTTAKLKELAAQGRLLPTDMILKEGMQQWVPARSVKGLFPEQPSNEEMKDEREQTTTGSAPGNPVAWVQEQFRTNTQRTVLVGSGAAFGLMLFLCLGCMGMSGLISGRGDSSDTRLHQPPHEVAAAVDYEKGPSGEKIDVIEGESKASTAYRTGKYKKHGYRTDNGQFVTHGLETFYYPSGKKLSEGYWYSGKQHGHFIAWYENGNKQEEREYVHGEQTGSWQRYYEHGQLTFEGTSEKGKGHGKFVEYFPNGDKKLEYERVEGKLQGAMTAYYSAAKGGGVMTITNYVDGLKDGEETNFHPNGTISTVATYSMNKFIQKRVVNAQP
jgi:antitoxin component YwqK of YwqJK toxin-antitoxin module